MLTPLSTHAMGNLGPKQFSSISHSRILNPLLNMPIFISGDKSKHGTKAPVPGCREEVQQQARSKTCSLPSSPGWPLQSCVRTTQMWDLHSYVWPKKIAKTFYIKDINKPIPWFYVHNFICKGWVKCTLNLLFSVMVTCPSFWLI